MISYVQYQSPPSVSPKKKFPAIKINTKNPVQPIRVTQPIETATQKESLIRAKEPAKSDVLLADPVKGKLFNAYFSKVKEKIQDALRRRDKERPNGSGTVEILFILRSDGRLEHLAVIEKVSTAPNALKSFSAACLRAASPFAPFPKDLGQDKISFSITLLYGNSSS